MEDLEMIEKEEVAVEEWAASRKRPPKAKRYVIRVDKQRVVSPKGHITGAEILAVVGKGPASLLAS